MRSFDCPQCGTRGQFNGQAFEILGRVRVRYDEGNWNEWFARFADGRWEWVADVC